ncbi:MAG TPA: GreA/GreB family elongation factor [Victivallales bacterium]|nr:GreA/GreB family elongation factor [Victivallales bacterium]
MPEKDILQIENLLYEAADKPSSESLDSIISSLKSLPSDKIIEFVPHVDLLLDNWGGSVEDSSMKSSFCLEISKIPQMESASSLRNALVLVARHYSPDFLSKAESVKLSLARDLSCPLFVISCRIEKLATLAKKFCAYMINSREWVEKNDVDSITHFVDVVEVLNSKKKKVKLDVFISDSFFFLFEGKEIAARLSPASPSFSFAEWKKMLIDNAVVPPDNESIRKISLNTFVPQKMTASEFSSWIENENNVESTDDSSRSLSDSRSLQEMHAIIVEIRNSATALSFNKTDSEKIAALLTKSLTAESTDSKLKIVSEVLAGLCDSSKDDESKKNILSAFSASSDKIFPSEEEQKNSLMEIWAELPASTLKTLIGAGNHMKGAQFMAKFALDMPLKALNAAYGILCEEDICKASKNETGRVHSDLILWAWKNKKKDEISRQLLSVDKIFSAISEKTSLRFRNNSIREIKKKMLSNDEFISWMAKAALNNMKEMMRLIDDDKALIPSEKQSLLVKLSRFCPEFKKHFEEAHEKGGMRLSKALSDNKKETQLRPASLRSYNEKLRELNDITTRQIPENSAAIAHARSYGDLRENAEYSAAKERQKFLNRRKFEIERELNTVAPTTFLCAGEDEKVISPGRVVTLRRILDSSESQYFVLGVWDGIPEKNMLSCESELAKNLIGKTVGEEVSVGGEKYSISSISFLPPNLISELNEEALE